MSTLYHRHATQIVPDDPYRRFNCSAYVGEMLFRDETLGGVYITGEQIRALSTEPKPDPKSPGLNIDQIVKVARVLRVDMGDRTGKPWTQLVADMTEGARIMAQIDYKTLGVYRAQPGDFGHAICIVSMHSNGLSVWASDPLAPAPRWYPVNVIEQAMTVFARQTGIKAPGLRYGRSRIVPRIA